MFSVKVKGELLYLYKYYVDTRVGEFIEKYFGLADGTTVEGESVFVVGCIMFKWVSGKKLYFYDFIVDGKKI